MHLNRVIASATRTSSTSPAQGTAARRSSRTCISRARTPRSIPRSSRDVAGCGGCFANSRHPAASRVTSACRHRDRSTKAASSATCSRTHSARRSTIRISSSWPSSATARRRPRRSKDRGRARVFSIPARDGAVLPILHLNGYKISGPTVLARVERRTSIRAPRETRLRGARRRGRRPVRRASAARRHARRLLRSHSRDPAHARVRRSGAPRSRAALAGDRAAHAQRVGRAPRSSTDVPVEGTFRAHQVPLPKCARIRDQLAMLEAWMRSYEPEHALRRRRARSSRSSPPRAARRATHGREPACERRQAARCRSTFPISARTRSTCPTPATVRRESTRQLGEMLRDIFVRNRDAANFRLFCPDETNSNRLRRRLRGRESLLRRADHRRSTITSRPTAA